MRLIGLAITLTTVTAACTPAQAPRATAQEHASVVEDLRAAGLRVESAGPIEQSFFSVPADVYLVGDGELQVYRYATEEAAARDAAKVDPRGSTIGASSVTWIAPPHFFRRGATIVNYLGSNERVLSALRKVMGAQFAGQ